MNYRLLDDINTPKDLKTLSVKQLSKLARELRDFMLKAKSTKQGHIAASFGVVELSLALHYVFDTPKDLLVWDVGHQCYAHKILTERKFLFKNIRQYRGISGFPKIDESIYDAFGTGHSSTSLSAVLGMATANALQGKDIEHIAVIGDASIVSGMALEALNHALSTKDIQMLIVLNDNGTGIDTTVGALKVFLNDLKNKSSQMVFKPDKNIEFTYSGVIDGHNIAVLIKHLQQLQKTKGLRLLHIKTNKGQGLPPPKKKITPLPSTENFTNYQDVFGRTLLELAKANKRIVGITPAMVSGSSLHYLMEVFPNRCFDVGIAEQHAVTLAAGMATQGLTVFCALYSTFAQRAYDQILHDVCLQKLPVIFCLDRAGLVGEDGATHHGVFDISFLSALPNIILACPMNEIELRDVLYTAQMGLHQPIAIRYPRGKGTILNWQQAFKTIPIGKSLWLRKGERIAVISTGIMSHRFAKIIETLAPSEREQISHLHCLFVKPLEEQKLIACFENHQYVLTAEEGILKGGFGTAIMEFAQEKKYFLPIKALGIPDIFIPHGDLNNIYKSIGIDDDSLKKILLDTLKKL